HSTLLFLKGQVFRNPADPNPAAIVVSRVQVGEVVETPLVFWTALLLWPAAGTHRWWRLAMGVPVFLGLEVLTTVCQLIEPLSEASAMLAGDSDPLTLLGRWSRFLEAGGRFAVEMVAALLTIAVAQSVRLSSTSHRTVMMDPYFRGSHNS